MSNILLCHHRRLGDHIICHGIVREYCKKYKKVAIFSLPHNFPSVSFMYRDLKNLTIIKGNDAFVKRFIFLNTFKFGKFKYNQIKLVGFQYLNQYSGVPFEKQFYQIAGVDFAKKWESFFVERDLERERALFKQASLKKDYVFLHEDVRRNFIIYREKIKKNYAIFTPDKKLTENIFDYCTIIEKAKEIHVIDSSFMFLIDCLNYENPDQKLYVHRYARENDAWLLPVLKKNWHIFA
jgi:hypothetical protein